LNLDSIDAAGAQFPSCGQRTSAREEKGQQAGREERVLID